MWRLSGFRHNTKPREKASGHSQHDPSSYNQKKRYGAYLMIIKGCFAYFFIKKLYCGCSLESPRRGDSNEHPQHRFL